MKIMTDNLMKEQIEISIDYNKYSNRGSKMKKKDLFGKVILILLLFFVLFNLLYIQRKKYIEASKDSMKIYVIGGSNLQEYGGVISCGYVLTTRNNELIVVDGGIDADKQFLVEYIKRLGNGTVSHWYITHPHQDHVGALIQILQDDECDITIENLYYSFNSLEWYKEYDERGFETEEKMINLLDSKKIKNKISCEKDQEIYMDNVKCEILKIADPEMINTDNGNDSSMCFKITATDVNKSIIFLGDAYYYASVELLKDPQKLKADVVQMAHHGQNGVSKEVYIAIAPKVCCFNCPGWLYNNNPETGYNSGKWKSIEVQNWVQELRAQSVLSFLGDRIIKFNQNGIEIEV